MMTFSVCRSCLDKGGILSGLKKVCKESAKFAYRQQLMISLHISDCLSRAYDSKTSGRQHTVDSGDGVCLLPFMEISPEVAKRQGMPRKWSTQIRI